MAILPNMPHRITAPRFDGAWAMMDVRWKFMVLGEGSRLCLSFKDRQIKNQKFFYLYQLDNVKPSLCYFRPCFWACLKAH